MRYFSKRSAGSKALLQAETGKLYLISLLVALIGIAIVFATNVWEPSGESDWPAEFGSVLHPVLRVVGQTCISAALITAIFNRFSSRQNATFVESIIGPALNEALVPSKDLRSSVSDAEYRWFCYIKPCKDEDLSDYLYQAISISRIYRTIPRQLHFYFAVSTDDDCLSEFDHDESRVLSWEVPPLADAAIEPTDQRVFSLDHVELNGRRLSASNANNPKVLPVSGGKAVMFSANVPAEFHGKHGRLSFAFHVLKPVGRSWRNVDINSRFYKENEDIEFTLICDPQLQVSSITPKIEVDEPRMLKNNDTVRRSSVFVPGSSIVVSHVKLAYARPGSSIHFEVIR